MRSNRSNRRSFGRWISFVVLALCTAPVLGSEPASTISSGDVVFYTLTLTSIAFFSVGMIVSRQAHWLTYSIYGVLALALMASVDGTLAQQFNNKWFMTDGPLLIGAVTAAFGFGHVAFRLEASHWLYHTRRMHLFFAILMAVLIPVYLLFASTTPSLMVPLYSTLNTGMLLMFIAQIFPPITWTQFSKQQHRVSIIWPIATALIGAGGYALHFSGPGFSRDSLEILNRATFSMHLFHLLIFVCISVLEHIQARIEAEQNAAETARQAAESALALERSEHNFERARALAFARSRQLASASHDLKQPITALRQVIEKRAGESEGRDVQRLRDAVDYLDQLTGTFLNEGNQAIDEGINEGTDPGTNTSNQIDEREVNQDQHAREIVSVNIILDTVTALFQEDASKSGMTISTQANNEMIQVQPLALTRALSNLVTNAIVHSGGKTILLRVNEQPQGLCIEVMDDGNGMTPKQAKQALKLRQRGDLSAGSGLGLAIVQALADEQNWRFKLQTESGQGLVATLLIPKPNTQRITQ